jgi:hypothetical protein
MYIYIYVPPVVDPSTARSNGDDVSKCKLTGNKGKLFLSSNLLDFSVDVDPSAGSNGGDFRCKLTGNNGKLKTIPQADL